MATPSPTQKLTWAIMDGNIQKIKASLKSHPGIVNKSVGDPIVRRKIVDKLPMLHLVLKMRNENIDVLDTLLSDPATDINIRDAAGRTLLHLGAGCGNKSIVKRLLDCPGINPVAQDVSGNTALHSAVINGQIGTARLLLNNTVMCICNNEGKSPMAESARFVEQIKIMKLLIENGADVNFAPSKPPISVAYDAGNHKSMRILLESGASIACLRSHSSSGGRTEEMNGESPVTLSPIETLFQKYENNVWKHQHVAKLEYMCAWVLKRCRKDIDSKWIKANVPEFLLKEHFRDL